jgi:transcriptional regulator, GntR family
MEVLEVLPKYEIIKQDILREIDEGKFKPGSKIYSEGDLKRIYNVSNTTVVKALNDLVAGGFLIRKQGEGTFVRKNMLHRKVSFTEKLKKVLNPKKNSEKFCTDITICNDLNIRTKFDTSDPLYEIVQKATIDETMWKIQKRYVQSSKLDEASVERIAKGGSVSKELALEKNLVNMPMSMTIEFKELDTQEAEELQSHSLVVVKKTIVSNATKEVVEYSETFIHPNFYEIEITAE